MLVEGTSLTVNQWDKKLRDTGDSSDNGDFHVTFPPANKGALVSYVSQARFAMQMKIVPCCIVAVACIRMQTPECSKFLVESGNSNWRSGDMRKPKLQATEVWLTRMTMLFFPDGMELCKALQEVSGVRHTSGLGS